jgi:hypothetical protein
MFKRPLFRKKLFVSTRPHFFDKDRAEGEKDLEDLVFEGKHEAVWVFSVEENRWFNLAEKLLKKVTPRSVEYEVMCRGFESGSAEGEMTHYHTHPLIAFREAKRNIATRIKSNEYLRLSKSTFRPPSNIEINAYLMRVLSIPSPADIQSYVRIKDRNKNKAIDFVILSPFGYTLCNLTNASSTDCEKYQSLHRAIPDFFNYTYNISDTYEEGVQSPAQPIVNNFFEIIQARTKGTIDVINLFDFSIKAFNQVALPTTIQGTSNNPEKYAQQLCDKISESIEPYVGAERAKTLSRQQALKIFNTFDYL